jgi:hypothetical protein
MLADLEADSREVAPLRAVLELAGRSAQLVQHEARAWASGRFRGNRHLVAMTFRGRPAIEAATSFMAILPSHRFALNGLSVIEACIAYSRFTPNPPSEMLVIADLLVLDD